MVAASVARYIARISETNEVSIERSVKPHRAAIKVIARELGCDPPAALCSAPAFLRSMAWMLEAAGMSATGIGGIVAVRLTAAAYLMAQRVWIGDDSPDLAPTMAELDRRLRGIERWFADGRPDRREAAAS